MESSIFYHLCMVVVSLTKRSGALSLLERGDSVMADRGFDIDSFMPDGTHVNILPFLVNSQRLDHAEVVQT